MRFFALLLTFAALVPPAFGAKRVTVAELEQTLATARNLPDADLAKQLSGLELTERFSTTKVDGLEPSLPGEQSRQALVILADKSAFLDPPAAEIPNLPSPDPATQRKMLILTVNYAAETVHRFPNFFATRRTRSFEDKPAVAVPGAQTAAYQPIHLIGDSNVTVTFRDGHEVVEKSNFDPRVRSLTTSGVFGPILGTVLVDAARSKLAWSHWEQGPAGLEAVFGYEVPKGNSHYMITYDSIPSVQSGQNSCTTRPYTFNEIVGYHGEMAVDPSSGTILRLALLADMKPGEFTADSGIEVQYEQVSIGGKDYVLPTRSVTYSIEHSLAATGGWGHGQGCPSLAVMPDLQTSLNDVVFANYHVFRSNATMLTDSEAAKLESKPAEQAPSTSSTTTRTAQAAESAPEPEPAANQPQPAPAANPASAAQSQPAVGASAASGSSLESPAPPGALPSPANSANSAANANSPVFKTTARQVLVDVVVDKKNGDPVSGLPQSDFAIEEDAKPQTIDFFEEHWAKASVAAATPTMPPMPAGALTNVPAAPPTGALYVLLLDSLNTQLRDQVYVRQQVLAYLHKMDPGAEVAVFALGDSLRLLQGFTSDPALLLAAVSGKVAQRDAMAQTSSDNADNADDAARLSAMQSAAPAGAQFAQVQAYSYGARSSMTFEALNALARYLEGIPGRKNLIWFATSFPVLFFPTPEQVHQIKNNPSMPEYLDSVKQTADLFTVSKIAVYPVSSAGVMTSSIGLAQSADGGGGTGHFGSGETNPVTGETTNSGGAAIANLSLESQNFATALTGMEQLASSTGGRAFTTNDIDNALHQIVHDSDVYYTVGYAPKSPTDGSFHRIDVKVGGGKYNLAYRQGYNAESAPANGVQQEDPIAPLLQYGLPNATAILYGASVTPGAAQDSSPAGQNLQLKGPLSRYAVSFTIRAQDVSFGRAPNGDRILRLLVGVKAYGKNGAALNWQALQDAADLTPGEYASVLKTGLPFTVDLDLPPDTPAELVTAVYDWNTARAGTLEVPLHP
jgi:VWFA-related protein